MNQIESILEVVAKSAAAGRRVSLCAIVATQGSTPQPAGTMLCVDDAARATGTIGGGCIEADVMREAHQLLMAGRSELRTFELDAEHAAEDGMVCGGRMDVAIIGQSEPGQIEAFQKALTDLRAGRSTVLPLRVMAPSGPVEYRLHLESAPKLVIAGGGHIGRILAGLMAPLGFRVAVVDDRYEFANSDRFPAPIRPVVGDIARTLDEWAIDANTYIVIVTRGHKHDERALGSVLGSPARYVGMIGSKRKIKVIYDDLLGEGASQAHLDRVHAPIGLPLGAVTPEEISISIAAELISVRREERTRTVEGPLPLGEATPS